MQVRFTIFGEPASKANSRRLVRFGARMASIKSAKATSYTEAFRLQCPRLPAPIETDVSVIIRIHYASRRPDLDESIILDAMQGLIYHNDRQVKIKHVHWSLDRTNPRADILVRPIRQAAVGARDRAGDRRHHIISRTDARGSAGMVGIPRLRDRLPDRRHQAG